eukprot:scaffold57311_cov56-Phaeocystis_antarctica.AAC.5
MPPPGAAVGSFQSCKAKKQNAVRGGTQRTPRVTVTPLRSRLKSVRRESAFARARSPPSRCTPNPERRAARTTISRHARRVAQEAADQEAAGDARRQGGPGLPVASRAGPLALEAHPGHGRRSEEQRDVLEDHRVHQGRARCTPLGRPHAAAAAEARLTQHAMPLPQHLSAADADVDGLRAGGGEGVQGEYTGAARGLQRLAQGAGALHAVAGRGAINLGRRPARGRRYLARRRYRGSRHVPCTVNNVPFSCLDIRM